MVTQTLPHDIETGLIQSHPSPSWGARIQHRLSTYILSGRILQNWHESIMIAGVAAAVIGIAFTFFSGMSLLCGCYTLFVQQ